jgi:glycosyltransferase involved in cell wall biosynthesis
VKFLVISTAKNAGEYARKCAESVARQTLKNKKHVYVDAGSSDETCWEAQKGGAVTINNVYSWPMLKNLTCVISNHADEDDVIVSLDGDDYLSNDWVLERVAEEYEKGALMTYGSFVYSDGSAGWASPYDKSTLQWRQTRKDTWRATHLKTYKASLFDQIPESYLKDENGNWLELACDLAVMSPMLDLARTRAHFIPDVLYEYNYAHSWECNNPDDRQKEWDVVRYLRSKKPL